MARKPAKKAPAKKAAPKIVTVDAGARDVCAAIYRFLEAAGPWPAQAMDELGAVKAKLEELGHG